MTEAFAFELPLHDRALAAQLIAAVPANWRWVNGQLDAPLELVAENLVARAGYKIGRFRSVEVATLLDGANDHDWTEAERAMVLMYKREAILELLAQGLNPLFVNFDQAGFDQANWGIMPFESAKQVAIAHVGLGYVGDLFFYSNCYDDYAHQNPEDCEIHLAAFSEHFRPSPKSKIKPFSQLTDEMAAAKARGDSSAAQALYAEQFPPSPTHPPLIKIEWNEKFGGRREHIEGLLDVCHHHQLAELDPESIGYGVSYSPRMSL